MHVTGTLLYPPADTRSMAATLAWIDAAGRVNWVSTPPGDYAVPRLSPDGARVAVQVRRPDDDNQIGVLDPARGSLALLPGAFR